MEVTDRCAERRTTSRAGAVRRASCAGAGVIALIFCLLTAWCMSGASRPTILDYDDDATRANVLAVVPIGTPIQEAERIMEEQGLSCKRDRGRSRDANLWCWYNERGAQFITWTWMIKFRIEDGAVSDVTCSFHGTGM